MLPIYLLSGKKKPKGGIQGLLNRCSLRTQQPRLLTADLVSASPPSELKKQSVPFSHTSMSLESQLAAALQVFSAANAFDIDLMASVLDDSVRWLMRPESISGGSSDGISKAEYIVFAANMKNMVAVPGFQDPEEIVQEPNKICFWIKTDGITKAGAPFLTESMFIFKFTPGTAKIIRVIEMLDSHGFLALKAGSKHQ